MHRSFSETHFLCYKACVGGGVDVGNAQDIASSATKIGAYQFKFFDFLPSLIKANNEPPLVINTSSKVGKFETISVVRNASFLIDCLQSNLYKKIYIKHIDSILLLAGTCIHLAPELKVLISLNDKAVVGIHQYSLSASKEFLSFTKADNLRLEIVNQIDKNLVLLQPSNTLFIKENIWKELEGLAANTYVSETEHSRLEGAGAGLTDND